MSNSNDDMERQLVRSRLFDKQYVSENCVTCPHGIWGHRSETGAIGDVQKTSSNVCWDSEDVLKTSSDVRQDSEEVLKTSYNVRQNSEDMLKRPRNVRRNSE
ncbi:unnamed protein product [Heligmosomoides polygyrus]|uniref:Ovule protein n=1 Tax=Heligmosomoides polygyrus TaxID=6339 RepID=A0A183FVU3_HELPZ|nr:unnamed protein product [Heligmosomoides polygyrus]